MARGGRRAGSKGTAYPNRTDLQGAQLPVSAPTGLPYGDRAKLIAAQRAVPMGTAPAPGPGGGGSASPPTAAPTGPPPPVPGGRGDFLRPTERPGEPVTAGLPVGPGPGPEALSMNQSAPNDPLMMAVAALDSLGDTADAATRGIRDAVHATLANRSVP